jgi:hypothetical protein
VGAEFVPNMMTRQKVLKIRAANIRCHTSKLCNSCTEKRMPR